MAQKIRILLIMPLMIVLLAGCSEVSSTRYFAFREEAFSAEICGSLHGVPFCATVQSMRQKDGNFAIRVAFSEPLEGEKDSFAAGIVLDAALFPDGTPCGLARISCHGVKTEVEASLVSDLLLPITAFWSSSALASVQRVEEGYALVLADGSNWLVDREMRPIRIQSSHLEIDVTRWEPCEKIRSDSVEKARMPHCFLKYAEKTKVC